MMYYIICTNEDGEPSLVAMNKETLLKNLNDNYWGDCPIYNALAEDDVDLTERTGLYIIAGELVKPKAKKVVEEWDL